MVELQTARQNANSNEIERSDAQKTYARRHGRRQQIPVRTLVFAIAGSNLMACRRSGPADF